jgi:hypothetical protein
VSAEATVVRDGRRSRVPSADLVPGDLVQASHRPYGLAFARVDQTAAKTGSASGQTAADTPFFLVLADAWHHELAPRALAL